LSQSAILIRSGNLALLVKMVRWPVGASELHLY
jgi:hypothetical protein